MSRIYIDRKAIGENRQRRIKGLSLLPPIMLESPSGEITYHMGLDYGVFRITYQPKELHPDGSPIDPEAPELWIEHELDDL